MDIVSRVLEESSEKLKSIQVEKHLELEYDLGSLLAIDINDLDLKQLKSSKDLYLKNLARDNTQLLFNKIWELPTERKDEAILALVPEPTYVLPREKPVPQPKPLTKWQKFAQEKGIKKKKVKHKTRATWDEVLQKWVPNYGFKRAEAEKEKDWLIEVPANADPMEDQFAKRSNEKSERVAKNEFQRLRNLAAAKNVKLPRAGLPPTDKLSADQLGKALTIAKVSTASLGKFQSRLPKEKKAKEIDALLPSEKKAKRPFMTLQEERKTALDIVDSIISKKPKFDIEKAVNREIFREQQERSEEKKMQKPRKGGGKRRSNPMTKGKGAGKRTAFKVGHKKGSRLKPGDKKGRKRR